MSIIVEDGTGLPDANSYSSEDQFDEYVEDRNYVVVVGDTESALIRATQSLDAHYGRRYPGTKTFGRDQGLLWPRTGATDVYGDIIDDDEIPIEIIEATCEFALRELSAPGSTTPDLERGGDIHQITAGSVTIVYGNNAKVTTKFTLVDGILSTILTGPFPGALTIASTRA